MRAHHVWVRIAMLERWPNSRFANFDSSCAMLQPNALIWTNTRRENSDLIYEQTEPENSNGLEKKKAKVEWKK